MTSKKQSSFLQELMDKLLSNYTEDFSQLCIVTPNRRAQVFIKNYLKDHHAPSLLPQLFSIDDFIQELSPYTIYDSVDLSFEFYQVYKELEAEDAQSFELFIQWAGVLINDFNEVDIHLGDANALFNYLSDDYAIREWNLGQNDLTDFQKNYLAFFHKLNDYYQYFKQSLLSQNVAYNGLAYRYVAEHIGDLTKKKKWTKIIFAGFNALTKSEEKIIRTLYESGRADLFWDVDAYYFKDKNQEAGLFFRSYAQWFKFDEASLSHHFSEPKNIQVIAVPKTIGQTKIAAELLARKSALNAKSSSGESLNHTALVLADENLLMPVLNSLDARVLEDTNVTMGYPLKNTASHLLFRLFIKMRLNAQRQQKLKSRFALRFFNEDILQILQNPLIIDFIGNTEPFIIDIHAKVYWTIEELNDYFKLKSSKEFRLLFIDFKDSAHEIIHFFLKLIHQLSEHYQKANEALQFKYASDWEALLLYEKILKRLADRILKYGFPENIKEFKIIFEQLIGNQNQSFFGEPLKGLQLMGLLETRTLDFENLILLSVNEDVLPSGKMANSFIPVSIKKLFNLPTYKEKNAIFAYHFYRLVQRAKNIHLLYSTTAGKLLGGEKSRFITQLVQELPKYNPSTVIEEKLYNFRRISPHNQFKIQIEKDATIRSKLNETAKSGFSPTAINTYVQCPLKFYFKYLVKIPEPDHKENYIDDRILGNIIHHSLHELYSPLIGKPILSSDLKNIERKLNDEIFVQAQKQVPNQTLDSGQNLLSLKAIEKYLKSFLAEEQKRLKRNLAQKGNWSILHLEEKLERKLQLPEQDTEILVFGYADRIDRWNKMIRVWDYKTGNVEPKSLTKLPLEDLFNKSKHDKIIQLLIYVWLLKEKYPKSEIQSGIIALRNVNKSYLFLENKADKALDQENIALFESLFTEFFTEIFDKNIPFSQTEEKTNCQYCPYLNICMR
jgi:CRISPR/Cas system-associated exonuclease Cas4 (RecB family)